MLLIIVPIGIAAEAIELSPGIVFGINAVAVIPLARLLSYATEAIASKLRDTLGALLNVSFGNVVELIIFIIALVKHEIEIVQVALRGSISANLLPLYLFSTWQSSVAACATESRSIIIPLRR